MCGISPHLQQISSSGITGNSKSPWFFSDYHADLNDDKWQKETPDLGLSFYFAQACIYTAHTFSSEEMEGTRGTLTTVLCRW